VAAPYGTSKERAQPMTKSNRLRRIAVAFGLAGTALAAYAQADYSLYGVADLSYGRFEPSGFERRNRVSSNSLSASFVGVNASYGLEGGWKPGITLETFVRFEDLKTGRNDSDPPLSRKAFVSLGSDYGTLSVGRLQTLLFDTTTRFNALGNSTAFSPAIRQIFLSGNLEGVQRDFYWSRGVGYASPTFEGVTGSAIYALGPGDDRGDLVGANIVYSRGLFAAALSTQRVHVNDGINDPTDERTWQLGATYNFGWARLFGLYTHTDDRGLDVRSNLYSAGAAVPIWLGTLEFQAGFAKARGPAVDRKHTSVSAAYLYAFNSVTDLYLIGMNDRIRGQTDGVSVAIGARYRF
jgi:predicted porin